MGDAGLIPAEWESVGAGFSRRNSKGKPKLRSAAPAEAGAYRNAIQPRRSEP